jgi:6-pyruvoyltetrahydropterin/6-carboxytetrahydropterin synthase
MSEYQLMVTRELIAQHFLTVPNPGEEGDIHSHRFTIEIEFEGATLNEYGYIIDIDLVNGALDEIEQRYTDALLNELPEFEGLNPSIENFARILSERMSHAISEWTGDSLTVRVWEDEMAWASHSRSISE